jgi:hypothetical protein
MKLLEGRSHLLGLDSPLRLDAVVVTKAADPTSLTQRLKQALDRLDAAAAKSRIRRRSRPQGRTGASV